VQIRTDFNWLVLIMRAGRLAALGWAEAEQPAQVGLELVGSVVKLTPGDADDAPAGGLEATVASAVLLERVGRVVDRAAVELHDEALRPPDAVHLDSLDEDVGDR
jgi:hypothetical protein